MCGIVGVVSSSAVDGTLIARMRDELAHRGPDHAGLWRSDDGRVCFGHRRLAIIDLDARANQPMHSHDGRFVVSYNGEIYNHLALRRELAARGAVFRTESDTETLIEAFRHWGDGCVDRLSGMFAFAIWDAHEQRLLCARDRAGEKPFYWAHCGDSFLFASEIKALAPWPALPRRIDPHAVTDFLTLGYVADPKSIWRDVRKLPPAHTLCVERDAQGRLRIHEPRRYWSLRFGAADAGHAPSGEQLRSTLLAAADEMSIADVPLGVFLSGGVDSSTVAAALSLSGHRVRSFTIGFDEADYDERRWARQVVERYHTTHVERTVSAAEVPALQDRLDRFFDEPFSDYSSLPTYVLCREARSAITVALSGDGADELFAGYRRYQRLARRAAMSGLLPRPLARGLEAASGALWHEVHPRRRMLKQYGLRPAALLADMLSIVAPASLLRGLARGPYARALDDYTPEALVAGVLGDSADEIGLVDAMRQVDLALTLPGDMLVKVDRASMAVALEVRPLFLHRAVMEAAAALPGAALAQPEQAKVALKDAVRPWLPDALLDRRKQGFALPLPRWLGKADAAQPARLGFDTHSPLGEWLDVHALNRLADDHRRGRADFTQLFYSCSVLERWLKQWMTV